MDATNRSEKNGPRVNSCWVCRCTFATYRKLVNHMREHEEKPLVCRVCPKAFLRKSALDKHERLVHTLPAEMTGTCATCNRTYQPGSTAADHDRVHRGVTPYVCSVCGKAFGHSSHLGAHLNAHIGVKFSECGVCGQTHATTVGLTRHLRKVHGVQGRPAKE